MLDSLIGKKIEISVGEPWDFVSDAGRNILTGCICLASCENEIEWLKCNVSAFAVNGCRISSVVAVNRYAKQSFKALASGEKVVSNFMYEPTGKDLDADQIINILANKTRKGFLVGSIILI